jgi:hypothetical protein
MVPLKKFHVFYLAGLIAACVAVLSSAFSSQSRTPPFGLPKGGVLDYTTAILATQPGALQQLLAMVAYPGKDGIVCIPGCRHWWFYFGRCYRFRQNSRGILYNPKMLLILGFTLLLLVPLCYGMARWMFHYAYGKHLKKLKALIDELS